MATLIYHDRGSINFSRKNRVARGMEKKMKLLDIYKCNDCGAIVEVVNVGGGALSCCGKEMQLMTENTVDASKEKHVPVLEETADGYSINVGSVDHPMIPEHYIQWVELIMGAKVYREFLQPGQAPKAFFKVEKKEKPVAREYCNLHGLWKA